MPAVVPSQHGARRQVTPTSAPAPPPPAPAKSVGKGKGSRNGKFIEQDDAPPCDNCFVWQLPSEATESFLEELFAQVGTVMSCKVVPSKRYGFVRLASVQQATKAISSLNGLDCHGTSIRVKYADSSPEGGSKGGGKPNTASPTPAIPRQSQAPPYRGTEPKRHEFGSYGAPPIGSAPIGGSKPSEAKPSFVEPESFPSDNVYVWQLPANCDERFLEDLFVQIGNVMSVKCVSDKRYGFVRFESEEDAAIAIREVDGLECEDTIIRVKYAQNPVGGPKKELREPPRVVEPPIWESPTKQPSSRSAPTPMPPAPASQHIRVFVEDLPTELSRDAVAHMLQRYCPSAECDILFRDSWEQVGMLSVPTLDEARLLVEMLHGNIPDGMSRPIRLAVAWPSATPARRVPPPAPSYGTSSYGRATSHPSDRASPYQHGSEHPSDRASHARDSRRGDSDGFEPIDNVYVNQLPPGYDEARLERLFSGCGRIVSSKCFAGYGFVRFATAEEAGRAIDEVNGMEVEGSQILCKFASKSKKKGA